MPETLDRLDSRPSGHGPVLSDDTVEQMLALAERLRAANGGLLDDSAIQAVAEATGTPADYVRIAEKLRTEKEKRSFVAEIRTQYLTLEPHIRRFVIAGVTAALCALFSATSMKAQVIADVAAKSSSTTGLATTSSFATGICQIIMLIWLTLGLYNACMARDQRTGAVAGAMFAGGFFACFELFGLLLRLPAQLSNEGWLIIPIAIGGALAGLTLQQVTDRYRHRLGLRDPVRERQELLQQLQDLQDRLKSGEQEVTFLSVDIVGSTKMKEQADPLAVEYTFNEYQHFVSRIARKYGGRLHSTAGDGVTCCFDNPNGAFAAAKNISAGLIELNTFRNKIGIPIVVRQGIHTGMVMPPDSGDITSVNFAHVIDISAHLQKVAPPGSIVISDSAAIKMPGGPSAIGDQRVSASGEAGTIWNVRMAPALPEGEGPPPLPKLV